MSLPPDSTPATVPMADDTVIDNERDAGPWSQADTVLLDIREVPTEETARSSDMPTIGHIGRYGLKYRIGEGGLGTVWAAYDPLLSRLIAIKMLHVDLPSEERDQFDKLFLNEARAAGSLSHPHIVTVFDAGASEQGMYIAMELLKGKDLRQLLKGGWRPTAGQAALIVRRVADALSYAHSRGVVHRDIKPANIFMVGRTQPRVLDFGIASVAHRKEDPQAIAGSPYYMAPEQLRGESTDRRTDVYALGVVLYELLTGERPYGGERFEEIKEQVLDGHPRPLSSFPHIPEELAEIATRAMAKNPDHRYRSARVLGRELRAWLNDHPDLMATAVETQSRARSNGAMIALGAVGALGAALIAFAGWNLLNPTPRGAAPAAEAAAAPRIEPPALVAPSATAAAPNAAATPDAAAAIAGSAQASGAAATELAATGAANGATSTAPAVAEAPLASTSTLATGTAAPAVADTSNRSPASIASATAQARPGASATQRETVAQRRKREREARELATREARKAVPGAAGSGTVAVAVTPWAEVVVDGASQGTAPPLSRLTLAEGRHTIVLRNSEFPPQSVVVDFQAGQTVTIRHRFGS